MIEQIFPKVFRRYLALPVLGPLMDSFADWLHDQHYTLRSTRYELRMAGHIDRYLRRRGVRTVGDITEQHLQCCYGLFRRRSKGEAGSVRVAQKFLFEQGLVQRSAVKSTRQDVPLNAFIAHQQEACGYAAATIRRQVDTAAELLNWIGFENAPWRLSRLTAKELEEFVCHLARRLGRASLQKAVSTIRSFLRFLAVNGAAPAGLDGKIDRPRVYREERLPRSLPWSTVQALLRSVNRDVAIGKRDYAMFCLMATYGLRACDVVALTLDDVQWRAKCIRFLQSKTGNYLELPLTDEVGTAIHDYLAKVPRYGNLRQLFLRMKAPGGILKSTAVIEAFQAWSARSGLDIPFKGVHCLRHSFALHFLRRGSSMKTIGDLLGHRSPESTAVYLRLSTEELRDVPLSLPTVTTRRQGKRS